MYLRLIGDRSIDKKDFERIQKDRSEEMQHWADKLKVVQQEGKPVKLAIVSANNHCRFWACNCKFVPSNDESSFSELAR